MEEGSPGLRFGAQRMRGPRGIGEGSAVGAKEAVMRKHQHRALAIVAFAFGIALSASLAQANAPRSSPAAASPGEPYAVAAQDQREEGSGQGKDQGGERKMVTLDSGPPRVAVAITFGIVALLLVARRRPPPST